MTNGASTQDRVLSWLRGETEVAETEDVRMEPLVITVSAQRREQILRRAGWLAVDFQFMVRDFNNIPVSERLCYLQFVGPRGETNTNTLQLEGGLASFPRFWIKPNGVLKLFTIPPPGVRYEGEPLIEGSLAVPSHMPSGYGVFIATQDSDLEQKRAGTQEAVNDELQAHGSAKFSIVKVVEIGGGVSKTWGTTQTTSGEREYTVRISRPTYSIKPAPR
jgi:hypothetical protein